MRGQNAEGCDLPPQAAPRATYVICGTPRTGSGLLCRLLQQTRLLGYPLAYLNQRNLTDWYERFGGPAQLDVLLPFIARRRTTPNGVFGLKCFFDEWQRLAREARIAEQLPGLRYVHIARGDLLAQAISLSRAMQTDAWSSSTAERAAPAFDAHDIERRLDEILLENASWEKFFALHGITPHRVTYEALSADPAGIMAALMAALEVTSPGPAIDASGVSTRPQRDALSAAWERAIRARHPRDAIRGEDLARMRLAAPRLRDLAAARLASHLRQLRARATTR